MKWNNIPSYWRSLFWYILGVCWASGAVALVNQAHIAAPSSSTRFGALGMISRRQFQKGIVPAAFVAGTTTINSACFASDSSSSSDSKSFETEVSATSSSKIAYRTVSLPIPDYDVEVPVACWFPAPPSSMSNINGRSQLTYEHRISVRRIGELLAGWEFIPSFASKRFSLQPSTPSPGSIMNGDFIPFPPGSNVIILAHGFLGSRFDLSHIAEDLASKGFVCISPEYPESLAASYERTSGLDRMVVNDALMHFIQRTIQPTGYGVVGHSLGCGTALSLGDSSWARVVIAGPPAPSDCPSPLLFITSMNDVFVRMRGSEAFRTLPPIYERLQEGQIPTPLPKRAALIFDRPDGPTHISYLSESVDDAMVNFLSPLLPLAQALSIPVLDFDRYQVARDAKPTAEIIKPLISEFFLQQLKQTT